MERSLCAWGMLIFTATVMLAIITLGGCTTAYPGSPQAHSGITEATVEKSADGSWKGYIVNGKKTGVANLEVTMSDGTNIKFHGEQIDGATGQAQQAAANAAIMERLAGSADKLIEKIPAR